MEHNDERCFAVKRDENLDTLNYQSRQIDGKCRLYTIFDKLSKHEDLTISEAEIAACRILDDLARNRRDTLALLAAFFGGLTIKEPTVEELTGMAAAMEATKRFKFDFNVKKPLVTTGGTGGDTVPTINVTTPAVIVAASGGAYALKSGARAFSSRTGSSDLAAALGINVSASREVVEDCVEKIGVTVWASEGVYPWMRPLIELGSGETASILMPFLYSLRLMIATALNPFSAKRQVRGVSKPFTQKVANVLSKCGYEKALVACGYGNTDDVRIDEYSNLGKTVVSELKSDGNIDTYEIYPDDIGIRRARIEEVLAGSTHLENAKIAFRILSGVDKSPRRDLVLLNAASILYLADEVKHIRDGYELANQCVDEGKAAGKLRELIVSSGGRLDKLNSIINSPA
jgi:anthranilate phosphoribosyltransferase